MQRYYIGQWTNNQMNGYGTLYFNETTYYEGGFVHNKRCGEGDWFNNQRHGFGQLLTIHGDHYDGHWSEDKKHGDGQYYFKKRNRLCKGFWLNSFCKSSECTQLLNKEHKSSASQEK
ncbi:hypothetical protein I4U23_019228 [Adineta vaga]|nr:hypothetical protein I4U23_019228 [Adineta vaga]